jgi:uncharacterized UPF0160 family protein
MIDAMKEALEAVKRLNDIDGMYSWVSTERALRQAIEEAEKPTHTDHPSRHWDRTCPACVAEAEKQEPVAWIYNGQLHQFDPADWAIEPESVQPLYTAPPRKEWVGLADEEIDYIWGITPADYEDKFAFPRAIEAKLKEKNT